MASANPSGMGGYQPKYRTTKSTPAPIMNGGRGAPPRDKPLSYGAPPPAYPTGPQQPSQWTPQSAPGYQEDYYTRNAYRWEQPSQTSQYWNGQRGWFNGPQQGETTMTEISDGLRNPGQGESTMRQNVQRFDQRGDFENWWNANADKFTGPSALEKMQGKIYGEIDGARAMNNFWNQTRGDLNDSYTEKMARNFQGGPSFSEDYVTGGGAVSGLDTIYDRLSQKSGQRLDNAAAARGGFNSGAALRNRQEMQSDLDAQYVRDYQAAIAQADAAKNARIGTELNVMQGGDSSLRGRLTTGYQGAMGSDQSSLQRAGAMQDLATALSADNRANLSLAGQFAGQSQQFGDNRLKSLMDYSERGDRLGMDRMQLRGNAATSAQSQAMQRIMGGLSGAGEVERDEITRLSGGQNAAGAADNARETRLGNMFERLMRLGGAQAGTYGQGMDRIRSEEMMLQLQGIDGMLKRGEISAAERDARYAQILQMAGMPLSVMSMLPGRSPAGPTPPPGSSAPTDPDDVYRPRF